MTYGQRQHVVERLGGLAARDPHLDLVAAADSQRGELRQAPGVDPRRVAAAVADPRASVAAAHLLHQPRGGPGVQPMRVGDDERAGHLVGVAGLVGHRGDSCGPEVTDLSGQCACGFGDHLVDRRSAGRARPPRPPDLPPAERGTARTRSRRSSSSSSQASSADSTALPRSISTTTPAPWSAAVMASTIAAASVPNVVSSNPAATAMRICLPCSIS